MSKSVPKMIGLTLGDPAGIGPEVTAKALQNLAPNFRKNKFFVLGDQKSFDRYFCFSYPNIELYPVQLPADCRYQIGVRSESSGHAAFLFLKAGIYFLKNQTLRSIVTAPVAKDVVELSQPKFLGHTEYFAQSFGVKYFDMMFVAQEIKTLIVTRHMPISQVASHITSEKVFHSISLAHESMQKIFKKKNPRIAVCGLNPHAGEGGLIGKEEIKIIQPAMIKAQKLNIRVSGPYSADTIFIDQQRRKFDLIISMYHDQGLIAMKALYFSKVVNLTIGLPFLRTSPAHGTAFDIAGKNKADPSSMIEAIRLIIHHS